MTAFTIRWQDGMGYRVSIPDLGVNGEPVHVVTRDEYDRLRLGFDALAALVREDGHDMRLSEIAATWTPEGVGPEHIAALRELEAATS